MTTQPLEPPKHLTPRARAAEITSILAAAIIRTHLENKGTESSVRLGFLPDQRVHTTPYPLEKRS